MKCGFALILAVILLPGGLSCSARDQKAQSPFNKSLLKAAAAQDYAQVKSCLDSGADPDAKDANGATALHLAVCWVQYDAVNGTQILDTPRIVALLLDKGADINAQTEEGMTPLMAAAGWHHENAFQLLLDRGADIHLWDKEGRSALAWAARGGLKDEMVVALKGKGTDMSAMDALLLDDLPTARRLIGSGSDLRQKRPYSESLLLLAAEKGNLELTRFFLDKGLDVNAHDDAGMTALHLAVGGRKTFRSQSGMIPSYPPDQRAGERAQIVRLLLSRGANPDRYNREEMTPLMVAAGVGNTDSVRALLEATASLKNQGDNLNMAFHYASGGHHKEAAQVLQKAGAKDPYR